MTMAYQSVRRIVELDIKAVAHKGYYKFKIDLIDPRTRCAVPGYSITVAKYRIETHRVTGVLMLCRENLCKPCAHTFSASERAARRDDTRLSAQEEAIFATPGGYDILAPTPQRVDAANEGGPYGLSTLLTSRMIRRVAKGFLLVNVGCDLSDPNNWSTRSFDLINAHIEQERNAKLAVANAEYPHWKDTLLVILGKRYRYFLEPRAGRGRTCEHEYRLRLPF